MPLILVRDAADGFGDLADCLFGPTEVVADLRLRPSWFRALATGLMPVRAWCCVLAGREGLRTINRPGAKAPSWQRYIVPVERQSGTFWPPLERVVGVGKVHGRRAHKPPGRSL